MQIRSVGIDLGKTTFHLVALSAAGKVLLENWRRGVRRPSKFLRTITFHQRRPKVRNSPEYAWLGPQRFSRGGVQLRAVVKKNSGETFLAGTRFTGQNMGLFANFVPEEYFIILHYDVLDEAIAAAKADTEETMLLIANRKPSPSKQMNR